MATAQRLPAVAIEAVAGTEAVAYTEAEFHECAEQ